MEIHTIHGPIGTVDVAVEDIYDEDDTYLELQLVGDTVTLDSEREMTYEDYFNASGQSAQDLIDAILLDQSYGTSE